jgi:hypothetical protein
MNPIEQLRAAKPAHLDPDPRVEETTRARELSYALSQARTVRSRRRIAKPAWGLSLVGAAAAVTAVAVTMSGGTGGGTGSGTPAPGGATSSVTKGPAPQVSLDARSVLLAAAHSAEVQPDKVGKYWHSSTIGKNLVTAGSYALFEQSKSEGWTPYATGADTWTREQNLGVVPATPADEAAWKAAGSPTKIKVTFPDKGGSDGGPIKGSMVVSTVPGAPRISHQPLFQGDKIFWLGKNVTMKDVRGLPSSPTALKQWLLRSYEGHGTEGGDKVSADSWLFSVAAGLITDMPVTPQVRGAAFRMLANLKSLKVTENVQDSSGRSGTAVSLTTVSGSKATGKKTGLYDDRLIFNKGTGLPLAREGVVIKPGGFQAGLKPGTVFYSTLVQDSGWTDSNPS